MILRVQYTEQKHCIIMRVQNKEQDLNPVREHCIIMSLIYSVGLEPSQGALYDIESSIYRAGPEPVREHCIIMRVLVKQPCYIQTKNVYIILKNDQLWSFFNLIYTVLESIFEPCYIQNHVIMNRVIKRSWCTYKYFWKIFLFYHENVCCVYTL